MSLRMASVSVPCRHTLRVMPALLFGCLVASGCGDRAPLSFQPECATPASDFTGVVHSVVWMETESGTQGAIAVQEPSGEDAVLLLLDADGSLPSDSGSIRPAVGDLLAMRLSPPARRPIPHPTVTVIRLGKNHPLSTPLVLTQTDYPTNDDVGSLTARHVSVPRGALVQGAFTTRAYPPVSVQYLLLPDSPLLNRTNVYARRIFRSGHPLGLPSFSVSAPGEALLPIVDMTAQRRERGASHIPPARAFSTLRSDLNGVIIPFDNGYAFVPATTADYAHETDPALNRPKPHALPTPSFSVATYNIKNLFDHRDDPTDDMDFWETPTRPSSLFNYVPASHEAYRARLTALARQIASDLGAPDLLLLQEIEDQDILTVRDGVLHWDAQGSPDGTNDILQELSIELAAFGLAYDGVLDRAGADFRGIVNAFLYRTDRLRLISPATLADLLDAAGLQTSSDAQLNPVSISGTHDRHGRIFARYPLLGAFVSTVDDAMPNVIFALNNHFKSQPSQWVETRRAQTAFNAAVYLSLAANAPDAYVILGGDLNVFPRFEDPFDPPSDQLGYLYEAGLLNLYDDMLASEPASAYTFVFHGVAQTLDHLFVDPRLHQRLTQAWCVHINADFESSPLWPERALSDHDPVIAVFDAGR